MKARTYKAACVISIRLTSSARGDYHYAKDCKLFQVQMKTPSFTSRTSPFYIFDMSRTGPKDQRPSVWFQAEACVRMLEFSLIILGVTEIIFLTIYREDADSAKNLGYRLSQVFLRRKDGRVISVSTASQILDLANHFKSTSESKIAYLGGITPAIHKARKVLQRVMDVVGEVLKTGIHSFGETFAPKKVTSELRIPFWKLETIPSNILDLLREAVMEELKSVRGDSFIHSASFFEAEREVTRIFRVVKEIAALSHEFMK